MTTATATWIADLPLEARIALATAESVGACDTTEEPVFYDVHVPMLGMPLNLGAITPRVVEHVLGYLRGFPAVTHDERCAIRDAIRSGAYAGTFDQGLQWLMRWVAVATTEED